MGGILDSLARMAEKLLLMCDSAIAEFKQAIRISDCEVKATGIVLASIFGIPYPIGERKVEDRLR
jgi:hypothetical protein